MGSSAVIAFEDISKKIIDDFSTSFSFELTDVFKWLPETRTVFYSPINSVAALNSLFHEISHALLEHKTFTYDTQLVAMERDAWGKTESLCSKYDVSFDTEHANNSMESYRSWIHERATCPKCEQVSLESEPQLYQCFNCSYRWKVSRNQICQIQRRQAT